MAKSRSNNKGNNKKGAKKKNKQGGPQEAEREADTLPVEREARSANGRAQELLATASSLVDEVDSLVSSFVEHGGAVAQNASLLNPPFTADFGALTPRFEEARELCAMGCSVIRKNADHFGAVKLFADGIVQYLHVAQSLRATWKDDPADGVRLFDFQGSFGEECRNSRDAQVVHQVALALRNAGIALYKLDNYLKAARYLDDSSRFLTTGLETKTHYWKSVALLRMGRYVSAFEAVETGRRLAVRRRRKSLSDRLFRKNAKMKRSPEFSGHHRHCRRLCDEKIMGLYDIERMFYEDHPGVDHAPYNIEGVQVGSRAKLALPWGFARGAAPAGDARELPQGSGRPGLFARRAYKKGDLVFVSKAIMCVAESDIDGALTGSERLVLPSMCEPLRAVVVERKRTARQQDLLKRFCEYLITKNGRDPGEKDILEETCFHFADGMGAVNENGEIDHDKVANELMKQEKLCEELLGEKLDGSKPPSEARVLLESFCEERGLPHSGRSIRARPADLDAYIDYCMRIPGADPTGDAVVRAAAENRFFRMALGHILAGRNEHINPHEFGADAASESYGEELEAILKQTPSTATSSPAQNADVGEALQAAPMGEDPERAVEAAAPPGPGAGEAAASPASLSKANLAAGSGAGAPDPPTNGHGTDRVLGALGTGLEPEEERQLRRASLLCRSTSYDFRNGAELFMANDGCPPEGVPPLSCLWLLPAFLNHSCLPNVARLHFGRLCFVQALRDIQPDEELSVCYTDEVYKRADVLEREWGFRCQCGFCKQGGVRAIGNVNVSKWRDVFETKVLPRFAPSVPAAVALKHVAYAVKLLQKLETLVTEWAGSLPSSEAATSRALFRANYQEPYYELIAALERRSENELSLVALELREKRILEDRIDQFGLLTLLAKRYMTLLNDHDKAKILLPMETEIIRRKCLANEAHSSHSSTLISSTMKSLLYTLDFPSSELVSHVHGQPAARSPDHSHSHSHSHGHAY